MHPIEQHKKEIELRGMMVFENINRMPLYGEPYISPFLTIGVCHSGSVKLDYDMQPAEFHAKEVSVIYPNHMLLTHSSSTDYTATLIVVSGTLFEQWRKRLAYYGNHIYHKTPAFPLTTSQYEMMCLQVKLVKHILDDSSTMNSDLLVRALEMLSQMCDVFRSSVEKQVAERTLYGRFYDLLVRHYTESRFTDFYAKKLCLSPKYFGALIKKETGMSVNQCISAYVVLQAKNLLSTDRRLSVQQIALNLGFADQSVFSRYFKAETGMTPSEFRKKHS